MSVVVTSKEELKRAYESKAPKIIITGRLAKQMKQCSVLSKVSAGAIAGLGAAITAASAAVAAMGASFLAAPATLGISTLGAAPAAAGGVGAIATICSTLGVQLGVVLMALSLGFAVVWGITHDYDMKFSKDRNGAVSIECTRRRGPETQESAE